MKIYGVFAGNQNEFFAFAREIINANKMSGFDLKGRGELRINDDRYLYIGNVNRLRGMKDVEPILFGTWVNRKDTREIQDYIQYWEANYGKQN